MLDRPAARGTPTTPSRKRVPTNATARGASSTRGASSARRGATTAVSTRPANPSPPPASTEDAMETLIRTVLADPRVRFALDVLRHFNYKNPYLDSARAKGQTGRKPDGFYGDFDDDAVLYAIARYPTVFPQWLIRAAHYYDNDITTFDQSVKFPSRSTLCRDVKDYRADHNIEPFETAVKTCNELKRRVLETA